jgi:hypothetical protein
LPAVVVHEPPGDMAELSGEIGVDVENVHETSNICIAHESGATRWLRSSSKPEFAPLYTRILGSVL